MCSVLNNDVAHPWLPGAGRPEFEQRRLVIAPGAEHRSGPEEWADALVVVESGSLEVECLAGTRRTFPARAILSLDWLPLRALRSAGPEPTVLVAIRRRREPPVQPQEPEAGTYYGR